jgi:hypothetical protein
MEMSVTPSFEKDQGTRLSRNDVSILLHVLGQSKPGMTFSERELQSFFQDTHKYLQDVGAYEPGMLHCSPVASARSLAPTADTEFFKFVDDRTLNDFILKGHFQFGSIQYYRDIENQNAKDGREGLASLVITTPEVQIVAALVSGYNFGIFCGTAGLENKELMSAKFGRNIIRIKSARRFADSVAQIIGAKRYHFNRVAYDDLKLFKTKTLNRFNFARNKLSTDFEPAAIDDKLFKFLCDRSFLPSLFMKPRRFQDESEIRIAFELSKDIPGCVRITDQGLLQHLGIIS